MPQQASVVHHCNTPPPKPVVTNGLSHAVSSNLNHIGFSDSLPIVERADKGTFTIPGRMLWRVKGNPFPDMLLYLNVTHTVARRFTVLGLDVGEFTWTTGL